MQYHDGHFSTHTSWSAPNIITLNFVFFPYVQNKNLKTTNFIPILSILTFSLCLWIFSIKIGKNWIFLWFSLSTGNQTGNSDSNHFCGNANNTEKSQIWPFGPKTYIFGSGQACEKNELGLIAFVDATGQTPSSLKNHKSERSVPKATFWVPDSSVRKKQMGRMVFGDATGPNP